MPISTVCVLLHAGINIFLKPTQHGTRICDFWSYSSISELPTLELFCLFVLFLCIRSAWWIMMTLGNLQMTINNFSLYQCISTLKYTMSWWKQKLVYIFIMLTYQNAPLIKEQNWVRSISGACKSELQFWGQPGPKRLGTTNTLCHILWNVTEHIITVR